MTATGRGASARSVGGFARGARVLASRERASLRGGRAPSADHRLPALTKAFVDVNEEGTEAAAATGVAMTLCCAAPRPRPTTPAFRADHPFAFAICDVRTGLILFLGRVERP